MPINDSAAAHGLRQLCRTSTVLTLLLVSGCATIFDGTSQEITVNTNPSGAACIFTRKGVTIGTIPSTPALLSVQKTKYDITITCNKPGYAEASYLNHSGVSAAIAGNVAADILLTAGLSSIVDSADGADNKYDSAVNLTLSPAVAANPAAAAPKVTNAIAATPAQMPPPPADRDPPE